MTIHDTIIAVRTGEYPSTVKKSDRRAYCAQCRNSIVELHFRVFTTGDRKFYLHCEAATCNAFIEKAKANKNGLKSGGGLVIRPTPDYVPRKQDWVFSPKELAVAKVIPDQRHPRRTTQYRVCRKDVTPEYKRVFVKLKDSSTGFTLKTGYAHATCVAKEGAA